MQLPLPLVGCLLLFLLAAGGRASKPSHPIVALLITAVMLWSRQISSERLGREIAR